MKKTLLMAILIIFTIAIFVVEIKTEFRDELEPKVSESSDYNGVLV